VKFVAVDWSGARTGAERKTWLAEAGPEGLRRLECGRSRLEVADHVAELARRDPDLVAGFDFGFSTPAWFLHENGWATAPEMWAAAAEQGETWLRSNPPWWGGRYGRRPVLRPGQSAHRLSDLCLKVGGISPKSVFQAGGAGSVGTGSVRGWPLLRRLRDAGLHIWPFDPPALPVVVEIYPRSLTGPVNKSNAGARRRYLCDRFPDLPGRLAETAAASEDAFDAAVSALVMAQHAPLLLHLPAVTDAASRLEGVIWHPLLNLEGLAEEDE
jgi:hypothetical protein